MRNLNNTCIIFNNESEETEIIKFYEDNGYNKNRFFRKISDENTIGILDDELNYYWLTEQFELIELPIKQGDN